MSSPKKSPPLDAGYVKQKIAVTADDGQLLEAKAEANWGAVRITLRAPVAGLTRHVDNRGVFFGMAASLYPEKRYALNGAFTETGLTLAREMLHNLYRDYRACLPHVAAIAELCRQTRQRLADLKETWPEKPWNQERRRLRQAFRAGQFDQREYQRQLKALRAAAPTQYQLEAGLLGAFRAAVAQLSGRGLEIYQAEELLQIVAPEERLSAS